VRLWAPRTRAQRRPIALGDEHRESVDRRRAEAIGLLGPGGEATDRVAGAPPGYLLAHAGSDIARHCSLLSPVPANLEVRVIATPGRLPGEWHLDIASRDRPGLLASFTGVLADAGIDVAQAVLATWDDGGALQAFVVRSPALPDISGLQAACAASLGQPLTSGPIDAEVSFNNSLSALYTHCDVEAPDAPGLLHAVAVAIAVAGADVHAARVTTLAGLALDHFDLSDPEGHKLHPDVQDAIRDLLRDGVVGNGPRRRASYR
jgi:UTP:GlnB (protein PII) uridylyltransferase